MADKVKGITIEFDGDVSKLDKAIREVRKSANQFDSELKSINYALKFNPRNVELLAQKSTVLRQKIEQTSNSLRELKNMQAQLDKNGVDKNTEEYRRLQREIIQTESKLKGLNSEMKKTTAQTSKVYQVGEAFDAAGQKITNAGHALQGVSAAAAAVTVALGGITYSAAVAADDINTLSKVTGISTYDLQLYAAAADLVDVSVEDLAKAQGKLKKSMLTASEGGSTLQYFEQLGVTVTDANGELRDSNDIFLEVIQALGQMENETERDAIAMQIFGKSAANLNPLIEDAGATYAEVAQMLEENGLEPISQEELDKANEFNDDIDRMRLLIAQAVQIIGTKVAGYLVPLMDKVLEKAEAIAEWLGSLDGETLARIIAIGGAIALLAPALIALGGILSALGIALKTIAFIIPVIGAALSFLAASPVALIIAGVVALVAAFVILWNKFSAFRAFFIKAWWDIKDAAGAVMDWFGEKKEWLITTFQAIPQALGHIFGQTWQAIKNKFAGWASFWGGLWESVKRKFTDIGTTIANAISGAVKSGINGVISRIENVINTGINLINGAIDLINKLPGVSVGKIGRLNLPRLAKGGVLNGAQTVIAGEAGPEAVIPLDRLFKQLDKMYGAMGGGATINVYGAEGQSAQSIAEEVRRVLIAEEKRRRMAWA